MRALRWCIRFKKSSEGVKEGKGFTGFNILEFHVEACRRYGELANNPALREKHVGDFDLIIASIAISHNEPLATRNVGHFQRIPELIVELW
jgi:predicted nucleic acid-binding protein